MKILIVCSLGANTGIGHYSRSKVISKMFVENFNAKVSWLFHGNNNFSFISNKFSKNFIICEKKLEFKIFEKKKFDFVIFDIHPNCLNDNFKKDLKKIKNSGSKIIAIDGMKDFHKYIDLIFIPSFYFNSKKKINSL